MDVRTLSDEVNQGWISSVIERLLHVEPRYPFVGITFQVCAVQLNDHVDVKWSHPRVGSVVDHRLDRCSLLKIKPSDRKLPLRIQHYCPTWSIISSLCRPSVTKWTLSLGFDFRHAFQTLDKISYILYFQLSDPYGEIQPESFTDGWTLLANFYSIPMKL